MGKGLSYKARRRWSLVILIIGLPLYIIVATTLAGWLAPESILVELLLHIVLGIAWILPFRSVFRGVGQADPDQSEE